MENGFSVDAALERTRAATAAKAAGENFPKPGWSGVKRQKLVKFDYPAALRRAQESSRLSKRPGGETEEIL